MGATVDSTAIAAACDPAALTLVSTPSASDDASAQGASMTPSTEAPDSHENAPVSRNHWEFTLGTGGIANSDMNAGSLASNFGLGYYLRPDLELSVRETFFYSSFPNGTNWMSIARGALDYQLNFDRWHPFFGPQVGYGTGIHNVNSFEVGGEVGLKYDFSTHISAVGMLEYDKFLRNSPFKSGIREDALIIFAGIGINW